jgi:hypothetical protein
MDFIKVVDAEQQVAFRHGETAEVRLSKKAPLVVGANEQAAAPFALTFG